ncbi:N-acetylmuramoyl-L-alanine amidase, partial [Streptomyces durbertensis]|uniref:N-acetylmuramoyl-L-alanine amidase n=1 Tax=Streptomyces durbertensis TaxID=2448886 RepID=UPI002B20F5EF
GLAGGPTPWSGEDDLRRPGGAAAEGPADGPVETRAVELEVRGDGRRAELEQRKTERFSMLGVTWTDPKAAAAVKVEARTRAVGSGEWSRWLVLEPERGAADVERASRGGTEPAWVGPSDGVEVRVTGEGRVSDALPEGLRLDMIDPGAGPGAGTGARPAAYVGGGMPFGVRPVNDPVSPEPELPGPGGSEGPSPEPGESAPVEPSTEPSPSPEPSLTPEPSESETPTVPPTSEPPTGSPSPSAPETTEPPAPPSSAPRPPIVSRAAWGADESMSLEEPVYLPDGRIKAVVVHHTAETNNYDCANSPAIVRGIYAYHTRTLGWRDLGYNFLVDKCGKVFEGRKGGVDRPVMGAHAYGFNTETTGIAVLGTHTDVNAASVALTAVARVAAWKLGQYGVQPDGTATLVAGADGRSLAGQSWKKGAVRTLPAIHGHRDGFNTLCPGDRLYTQLGTIRARAAGPVTGLAVTAVTGGGAKDGTTYTRSEITVEWTATTPASLISRYELLVNGKVVATTKGNVRTATTALPLGTHRVAVRAIHQSGKAATTPTATVVAETTAPTFTTRPTLGLRTGIVEANAVPVRLSWAATDNTALKNVRLLAPVAKTYAATTTGANHTAVPGTATAWQMRATDLAGNVRNASPSFTPVIVQETAATRSGTWTTRSDSRYLGGKSYSSGTKGSKLTYTFTGRSAALVFSRASSSGQVHVLVDGKRVKTVDLKSATTRYRDAVWTQTWDTSAKRTVTVEVVATSGRPTITTDGLVYIR